MDVKKNDMVTANIMNSTSESRQYIVVSNDNFSHPDDNEPLHILGTYKTYNDAVVHCKKYIEYGLEEVYINDMTADELYKTFSGFGETAFVISKVEIADKEKFSSQNYAKEMSIEICSKKWQELVK